MEPPLFSRSHHRRIAKLLASLDAGLLAEHNCLLGGGVAISLPNGEFREARDIDFRVCDRDAYRELRGVVTSRGMEVLLKEPVKVLREVRMDRYGFRALFEIDEMPIKFEVMLEARIDLDSASAGANVCGVRALSHTDQVAEKLLANSDRWSDDKADSRDIIDLAMMLKDGRIPRVALDKAGRAYNAIEADIEKAKAHI